MDGLNKWDLRTLEWLQKASILAQREGLKVTGNDFLLRGIIYQVRELTTSLLTKIPENGHQPGLS